MRRSVEDKVCYNIYSSSSADDNLSVISASNFDFHNAGGGNRLKSLPAGGGARSKPTPSKWDDAQKWLSGLSSGGASRAGGKSSCTKPRNSNADDRRLLSCPSQKHRDSCSSVEDDFAAALAVAAKFETKKIDSGEPPPLPVAEPPRSPLVVRSVCLRDMGTEMTPIGSQEPSRTATPVRATTPISSRTSTPARRRKGASEETGGVEMRSDAAVMFGGTSNNIAAPAAAPAGMGGGSSGGREVVVNGGGKMEVVRINGSLESRAVAWDEAERAKYMAKYKREEVKIQVWENHEKRKAEMEMKKMEVKAERMKARAQEKLAHKLAATRRMAEEQLAIAEAKLNERAARTSERADYIRRTGRLPSSFFSFKMPSLCG